MRKTAQRITSVVFLLPFLLLTIALLGCSGAPNEEHPPKPSATKESATPAPAPATAVTDLSRLFGRIWRISNQAATPAPGSIYIFLPNGTLLETSCVETYRIAAWSVDQNAPGVLRVVEDGQPVFTATLGPPDKPLQLQKTLLMGNKETQDVTLTAVDQEFVCPDLPK